MTTTTEIRSDRPAETGAVAARWYRFLARQGYAPVHLSRGQRFGQVGFMADGMPFRIQVDEEDADFWQVALRIRLAPPLHPELEVLRVIHDVQAQMKLAKIRVAGDQTYVEFQAPVLLRGRRPSAAPLRRCMRLLCQVASEFQDRLVLLHPAGQA